MSDDAITEETSAEQATSAEQPTAAEQATSAEQTRAGQPTTEQTSAADTEVPDVLRVERHGDVAVVVFDVPDASVNSLRAGFEVAFDAILDELARDTDVRGVVLTSGKRDSFVVGADLDMLREIETVEDATALSRSVQRMTHRMAAYDTPLVAAIHGACLGGGLELALACHARIATDDPSTRLGLPEVQLGIVPGAGGTQRLPQLVGVEQALEMILSGDDVSASKARRIGLVDDVVHRSELLDIAAAHARLLAEGDTEDGGRRTSLVGRVRTALLEDNPAGRTLMFRQAEANVRSRTRGAMPAPMRALEVVRTGVERGPEAGFAAEADAFGELLMTPQSRNLIRVFELRQQLRREARRAGERGRTVHRIAVVGAGLMGSGIAAVTVARADLPVRLRDVERDALRRGLRSVREYLDHRVSRRKITEHERDRQMALLRPGTDEGGYAGVDLVVEAVVEDLGVKHKVLEEVVDSAGADVIVASNTSSIPIDRIADGHPDPSKVVGMHYFSPVPRVPLLEVIEGPRTAPEVTATAVDVGRRQGMTVVVVDDGPGFYTSRILVPYLNEAAHLLADGATVEAIDGAFEKLGFPVGPFRLVDEVGIDVAAKIGEVMYGAFGDRMAPAPVLEAVVADGRQGRKNGRGFYRYRSEDGRKVREDVDGSIYELFDRTARRAPSRADVIDRPLLAMVNEALWTLDDGVLRSARDGDAAAVFGLGFPPQLGGPLRYLDDRGATDVADRLRQFEADHGARFTQARSLRDLVLSGDRLTYDGDAS